MSDQTKGQTPQTNDQNKRTGDPPVGSKDPVTKRLTPTPREEQK